MRLKDRVAIITGAARGIGATFAKGFAQEGAKVIVCDIREEAASEVVDEIRSAGNTALSVGTDVTKAAEIDAMVNKTIERFGRIDILINNASIFLEIPIRSILEIAEEEWDRVLDVNLKGVFLCSKAVFPLMKKQGKGKIINIHSSTVYHGGNGRLHYVSSKSGVIGFTRALAREAGKMGINVNTLTPGSTITEGTTSVYSEEVLKKKVQGRCIERLAMPKDLLGAAIFLASDDSDFMTGQSIVVDGGKIML